MHADGNPGPWRRFSLGEIIAGLALISFCIGVICAFKIHRVVELVVAGGFIALCILIGWSAVKFRSKGWAAGLVLAVLLITIPIWVGLLLWLFGAVDLEPH